MSLDHDPARFDNDHDEAYAPNGYERAEAHKVLEKLEAAREAFREAARAFCREAAAAGVLEVYDYRAKAPLSEAEQIEFAAEVADETACEFLDADLFRSLRETAGEA